MCAWIKFCDINYSTTSSLIVYHISSTLIRIWNHNIFTLTNLKGVVAVITEFQLRYYPRNFIDAQLVEHTSHASVQDFDPVKRTVGCVNRFACRTIRQ